MRSGTAAGTARTGHGPAGTALLSHRPEGAASEPREPEEERERPIAYFAHLPFPRRRANSGGTPPGGQRWHRLSGCWRVGSEWVTHAPRAPGALRCRADPPLSRCRDRPTPFPRVPGGTHRLGGGSWQQEAEQQHGEQRDAGQRHGWAGLCRDTRRNAATNATGAGSGRALPPPPPL